MGTRADFYVGRGDSLEWLGSIAWDGYPDPPGHPSALGRVSTEAEYRDAVETMLAVRPDATRPADGWPWPWPTSATTDFAYSFHAGNVIVSNFGGAWLTWAEWSELHAEREKAEAAGEDGPEWPESPVPALPSMERGARPTLGPRSGLLVMTSKS